MEKLKEISLNKEETKENSQLLKILASCHSLTYVHGKLIGDPLDIKMFDSTKWVLNDALGKDYDKIVRAILKSPESDE